MDGATVSVFYRKSFSKSIYVFWKLCSKRHKCLIVCKVALGFQDL